ncbi:MAG: hypothetical protein WD733_05080 [Bryobacterales bacterium]
MPFSRLATALLLTLAITAPLPAQLSTAGNQIWSQGFDDIIGNYESNDRFGAALAAGDFNGDGWDDLAIGSPGESSARGIVNVIYGSPGGLTAQANQTVEQGVDGIDGNAESGDSFGFALAADDFNNDGYDDLAIGAPGEDTARGIVQVIYGSSSGLTSQGNQAWRQGNNDIRDSAEASDSFGFSLATGDFNGDGFADLAAGGPGEDTSQGLVIIIFGAAGGLTSNGNQRWREGDDGLRGSRETFDLFGYSLAAADFNGDGYDDLAVGTPGENNARGTANIIFGSSGGLTATGNVRREQGSDGVPDTDQNGDGFAEVLATGDFNNDGFADLAAAALGDHTARGSVIVMPGSSGGLTGENSRLIWQATAGVGGDQREEGDRFGSALGSGDFNADGFDDLAIGVRGEDGNRGLLQVLYGSSGGVNADGNQVFAQGASGLADQAEVTDDFGFKLVAANFGIDSAADVAVGAPGEDDSAGVTHILFGKSLQPSPVVGAVVGAGLSVPAVARASYNSILTIFGENFQAAAASAALLPKPQQGNALPTNRDGVCVEMDGRRTPLFLVSPGQINLQAVTTPAVNSARVEVILNCDQPNALRSAAFNLPVSAASPEFFFFVNSLDGINSIAAVNETTGALVGAAGLIPGAVFEPAKAGETVTLFMTGLGVTEPRFEPGEIPTVAAPTTLPVRVQLGGVAVDAIYAGVTPSFTGLYQVSFTLPAGTTAGNAAVQVTVGDVETTPPGGYLTVGP